MFHNLGEEVYRSWSDEQRREEIGRLVQGFRSGLPVEILCAMAGAIAGSPKKARKHLASFMPRAEREEIMAKVADAPETLGKIRPFLL